MTAAVTPLDGRYRLEELLGRGGMSDVHRATDLQTGAGVAVKLVRSGDPELARRLAQEVQVLERFEHPGLVRLLDTGFAGDLAYLVMELVDGQPLDQRLRTGPLGTAATARLGATIADALAYVHARGIVHRDIKPANVLLSADGRPMLADFGIARLVDASSLTLAGTTLGTTAYMAPEQLADHRVGPAADVWSLGIVLLECLTGRRVYEGPAPEVVARRLAGPVPLPDNLPVPWKILLRGMLEHRPADRLRADDVAGMLPTAPLQVAWDPAGPATEHLAAPLFVGSLPARSPLPTRRADLTAASRSTPATAPLDHVPRPVARVTPRHRVVARRLRAELGRRDQRPWLVGTAAAVLLALLLALVLGNGPSSGRATPQAAGAAAPDITTTTTSTTTTVPPTTVPPTTAPPGVGPAAGPPGPGGAGNHRGQGDGKPGHD